MLNYNKIHSVINFDRTSKRKIADFLGISNSTFVDRLNKENFTPNDIEKLSDFFDKPLDYWFDREEKPMVQDEGEQYRIRPEVTVYECPECITKQKEIDRLRNKLEAVQDRLIEALDREGPGQTGT